MPSPQFASPPTVTTDEILNDLRHIEAFRQLPGIILTPLAGNPRRRDHPTRRTFTVSHAGKIVCHLTVARDLQPLWQRTEAFHQACPSVTGKPLFYEKGTRHDYLAREFIDGKTVEYLVSIGKLTTADAHHQAAKIQQALDATTKPSDISAAKAEASHILEQFYALPFLSALDRAVFREMLAPLIISGIETTQPRTRWTNGDFTPHNLLIDPHGAARLIDYEFANRTHFFAEDSWRWRTFSHPAQASEDSAPAVPEPAPSPPWLEIFFWAKQLVLSHETILPEPASIDSVHAMRHIVEQAGLAGVRLDSSLFLQSASPDARLQAEVDRLKIERHELSDKITRMHRSRSWRYTAWLRAIRRWLA